MTTAEIAPRIRTSDPQELVVQCLRGDRQAQKRIYQLYSKAMYNVCLRMVGNQDEAQDVLQDAFVSAFRHLSTFKAEATFGAWLKRIVVNTAIQHLKRKRIDFVALEPKHNPASEPEPYQGDPDSGAYEVRAVQAAVLALPDGYRNVLTLYLFEGYDHAEIGDILGITESTSKSQFNRAKARLKAILLERGFQYNNE
jgi:RNA polymerase sigma factor (sigma-70 family)